MAAVTALSETPAAEPAGRPRGMQARRRRRLNLFRYVVFTVFGLFFLAAAAGDGPVLPGGGQRSARGR